MPQVLLQLSADHRSTLRAEAFTLPDASQAAVQKLESISQQIAAAVGDDVVEDLLEQLHGLPAAERAARLAASAQEFGILSEDEIVAAVEPVRPCRTAVLAGVAAWTATSARSATGPDPSHPSLPLLAPQPQPVPELNGLAAVWASSAALSHTVVQACRPRLSKY